MKLTRWEIAVATAGALLDVPRFADLGAALHGATVGELVGVAAWQAVHATTSGAFAVVVAGSIVLSFGVLARPQRRNAYVALLASTVAMLVAVAVAVYCALRAETSAVFTAAAVVAPLLVVVNVPLAAALRESAWGATMNTTPPQQEAQGDALVAAGPLTIGAEPTHAANGPFRATPAQQAFLDAVAAGADPDNTAALADVLRVSPATVRALRSRLKAAGAIPVKEAV